MRNVVLSADADAGFDEIVDVVVVGSGAAGLGAATLAADGGASVVLLEKSECLGGTTALSGGAVWVPGNEHTHELGLTDSREAALAYLTHLGRDDAPDPALVERFVDEAPRMLAHLERHTPLRMAAIPGFPDYYLHREEVPGGTAGGRAVEPMPFGVSALPTELVDRLPLRSTLLILGTRTTHAEERAPADPAGLPALIARREADDVRVKGVALVAALLRGLLDRGVEVRADQPVTGLVLRGDAVIGVRLVRDGVEQRIGAARGVVLASGGYEWDPTLVRSFIGYDLLPATARGNTGDGLQMLMEAGSALANMRSYFGTVLARDPGLTGDDGEPVAQAGLPVRTHPGAVVVDASGRRFVDEHARYNDFPKVLGNARVSAPGFVRREPLWLLFDSTVRATVPVLSAGTDDPDPDWLHPSGSIAELAERIGVDDDTLARTVADFNSAAESGHDPAFGRRAMAPVARAPYYALRIHAGTLGTTGGARISANGEVLRPDGTPISGLYAAGGTAAGVFGFLYPSGGAPIAMSLTFGCLAGRHAAGSPERDLPRSR